MAKTLSGSEFLHRPQEYELGRRLGSRWLGLNALGHLRIHGTNNPGLYTMASGGCIRMFNRHVTGVWNYT